MDCGCIVGSVADYGGLRKKMMISTAYLGALLTIAIFFVSTPHLYWLSGLFMVLSNVFFGYSVVFYNAFLAPLVRSHPEYIKAPKEERHSTMDSIANTLSTRGFMAGYAAGTFLLVVSIPIVFFLPSGVRPYYECVKLLFSPFSPRRAALTDCMMHLCEAARLEETPY
jgi:MFS-type transporter involved in bile tolerance (Atg22 family)